MEPTLGQLVEMAKEGDRRALEELVGRIKDRIYGLAIRMLYLPADAEDATQEILIKIITHLNGFRGESSFLTWVYSIASKHLLTSRKRNAERWNMNFDIYAREINDGLSMTDSFSLNIPEQGIIVEEIKLACLQGMLLCLGRKERLAFILGEVFEVSSEEGGKILGIRPSTFRKRLSRGRKEVRDFMSRKCSLFDEKNPCHCERQVFHDTKKGWIDPENLKFAAHPQKAKRNAEAINGLQELDEIQRVTLLFRTLPDYTAPDNIVEIVKKLVDSNKFSLLQ